MNKIEHIEEMATDLDATHDYEGCEAWHCRGCEYEKYGKYHFCSSIKQAEKMTARGYLKQKEGEFVLREGYNHLFKCTACGYEYNDLIECMSFCGNCGAKMKGE